MTKQRDTVVVGIDGSECSRKALTWAERYASAVDADLKLVTAWHWLTSYGVPLAYEGFDPAEDARKMVEAAAADLGLPVERILTVVEQGPAGNVLVDASNGATALVVGTRGHGTLAGALLGSTSSFCMHHAPCPVVVVR
jgi:nucleotide-binding universal stress UspA family protein